MLIIAHRGLNNHQFKENTLEAFKSSLNNDYIDEIELDVRMTKDNKLIIHHNPFILENGIHIISKSKYNNLLKKCNKEITLLSDGLEQINTNKQILIELKEEGEREEKFIKKLLPILNMYEDKNILVCSFNDKILRLLEKVKKA